MGFLDRLRGGASNDEDEAAQARRDADIARITGGGIPLAAEQRIRELGAGEAAFTSNLSVAHFALTRLDSIRPVCQVMGSSIYKVGWQNFPWGSGWGNSLVTEMRAITDAWNHARSLAIGRLEQEARMAGCHAVVDVQFGNNRHEFLNDEIEIIVNGTAVHLPEGGRDDRPILTDLSLPDYTLLRRCGYSPVGIVASTSVYYVVAGWQTRQATRGWQRSQANQELVDFTQGVYSAREAAIARASAQALQLGAGGMIGMTIDHDIETREVDQNDSKREDLIVTFHVIGTAIAPEPDHKPLNPMTIVRQGGLTR